MYHFDVSAQIRLLEFYDRIKVVNFVRDRVRLLRSPFGELRCLFVVTCLVVLSLISERTEQSRKERMQCFCCVVCDDITENRTKQIEKTKTFSSRRPLECVVVSSAISRCVVGRYSRQRCCCSNTSREAQSGEQTSLRSL
jgi:hypothetical protein